MRRLLRLGGRDRGVGSPGRTARHPQMNPPSLKLRRASADEHGLLARRRRAEEEVGLWTGRSPSTPLRMNKLLPNGRLAAGRRGKAGGQETPGVRGTAGGTHGRYR